MLKSKKSILNKFMTKDELVSMRLHLGIMCIFTPRKTTLIMSAANTAKSDLQMAM